ncbi:MAG: Valine-tRNA ligase [Candidatus Roizmanbacteria bacterium GW2011_GWA2_37_7]|uniref:Valine--tRNA ligase n=1 Tax=Candidatus Roizmanbacteria bacterium GW2011_GWA2_37_7 TaxID=1618481 RepID=A0A0G0HHG4_9BACT|nr:MAG: Valine-tRNA ligase [Candidatus Roizmanbacteria bacterium GW2011_GWA2_37_7]
MTKDTTFVLQIQAIFVRVLNQLSVVRSQSSVMDKIYSFRHYEETLYTFWEDNGYFTAKIDPSKKPFCIILPPPNANADLHLGHAMYVYEDVMIRYNKLMGNETLWLVGADHAGIETQFVYEKYLKKQGKSRFDFDRKTLFNNIWEFVMENRGNMENQLRKLGFALDWSKKKFTMDEDIVKTVYLTFKHLYDDGLVYRANRLVNYCTSCGTSFSDLEVVDKEVVGNLYYIQFPIQEGGSVTIATTRPETYLGDVAVMVNPKDKRYQKIIGKTVLLPLINREIPVIADEYVDPKFGTGAVKVTPAHDENDFQVAQKHGLWKDPVIDFNGHMQNTGLDDIDRVYVVKARKLIITKLEEYGFLEKITPHDMVLHTCYRCGTTLEPLPKEQWFINVKPLKKKAIQLVKKDEIRIHPKRFKKQLIAILENFIDWNVSRQIVWGIQIPAYRCEKTNDWFVSVEQPTSCQICGKCKFIQDKDTFDTWFSSAQWPYATLQSCKNPKSEIRNPKSDDKPTPFFDYFYPTSVMETGYDILRAWVSRMIMIGYFETKTVPFQHVFLHGMVRDKKGQKMSKSKGNVINPLDMIKQYGADAVRAALIFGTKEGGDVVLSEDKILAMRNFCNKIWNIGRFIEINQSQSSSHKSQVSIQKTSPKFQNIKNIEKLRKEFAGIEKKYHTHFKNFEFAKAFDLMYEFVWHRFADYYIEELKDSVQSGSIEACQEIFTVFRACLQMLHPYTPFVTEAVWKAFHDKTTSIMQSRFEHTNKTIRS